MAEVTVRAVAVVTAANIPVPLQKIADRQDLINRARSRTQPEDVVSQYTHYFRDGKILRASGSYEMCGKGLWMVGDEPAEILAAAIVQALALEGHVGSAYWVDVNDFIESESPGGERLGEKRWSDILVIQGAGEHHKSASGWSDTLLYGLIRRRYDQGLPTVVASPLPPENSGLPASLIRKAFVTVTFGEE